MDKSDKPNWNKWIKSVMVAVAEKPGLIFPAIYQLYILSPESWYRKYPFLPLPDKRWLRFRMETAYGDPCYVPNPREIAKFLDWTRTN